MAPSVMALDAARFQVAAPLLGTAHPTGYPTFIMLGHLFTYLPFGDVAYRVNLLSAVAGALAVGLFVPVARHLGARVLPAAGCALLYAFSSTFWGQATGAEVYTLHAAFVLAVLLLLLRWRRWRRAGDLLLAAGLFGLALGNNAGTVLLAPAFLVLILDSRGRPPRRLFALSSGVGLFVGLSVYAYLPLRGFAGAWHNYGDPVHDWHDVWRLVSGSRFQRLVDPSPENLLRGAEGFWWGLLSQASYPIGAVVGLVLACGGLAGAVLLVRRDRIVGVSLLVALAATLGYALSYRIADVAVYFLPVYLLLALFLAVALSALGRPGFFRRGSWAGLAGLVAFLPLALAGAALALGYGWQDRSWDYGYRAVAEETLAALPPGAVLYGRAEILPLTYLKEVEGERPDVTLRWLDRRAIREGVPANLEEGKPVYLFPLPRAEGSPKGYPRELEPRARPVKEGRLIQLVPRQDEP